MVIAGRSNGFIPAANRDAALAAVRGYRELMAHYAQMGDLDVWYANVSAENTAAMAQTKQGAKADAAYLKKAHTRDNLGAFSKLVGVVDGHLRIMDAPPVIEHLTDAGLDLENSGRREFAEYRATLEDDRQTLLSRYRVVDMARKVVGIGSASARAASLCCF